jgi:hypothetical protein
MREALNYIRLKLSLALCYMTLPFDSGWLRNNVLVEELLEASDNVTVPILVEATEPLLQEMKDWGMLEIRIHRDHALGIPYHGDVPAAARLLDELAIPAADRWRTVTVELNLRNCRANANRLGAGAAALYATLVERICREFPEWKKVLNA